MSALRQALMLMPVLAALGGCVATTAPLALTGVVGSGGDVVTTSVPTTIYTGLRDAPEEGVACRGSYTGAPSSSVVLLEVECPDGHRGIGTGLTSSGKLVGGSVRMRDGVQASVRVEPRPASR